MKELCIKTKLPDGIPAPRFQLFQRVNFQDGKGKPIAATVAGMFYTDFATAILERSGETGWRYELNKAMGKSQDELLSMVDTEITFFAYEESLTATGDAE